MGLTWDTSNLKVDTLSSRADAAIRMYAETQAQRLISSAREHRPWTDRTGAARNRLHAWVSEIPESEGTGLRINLAHGVDYGIWLELAMEKRFATLFPTVTREGPEVVKGFENLLEKIR